MNIVVCLSRDRTVFSGITYLADGGGFTHASLGLSEDAEFYYSFNFKGLKKEYRTSLKKRPREMQRFIIAVSDEAGEKLNRIIDEMEAQKEKYQYAKLGVSLRLLNLPNENPKEDQYYCSQFVAAVLKASGCVPIQTDPAACTPNDLLKELERSGQIVSVEEESDMMNPGEAAIDKVSDQMWKGHDKLSEAVTANLDKALNGDGKVIPALALQLGLNKLNPLYEKLMDRLDVAEEAVGESSEKFARLTSGLLKNGSEKLLETKEKVDAALPDKHKKKE